MHDELVWKLIFAGIALWVIGYFMGKWVSGVVGHVKDENVFPQALTGIVIVVIIVAWLVVLIFVGLVWLGARY